MIDFHSHILPMMDDGSQSIEESCKMLTLLSAQGVTKVAATPHFYANNESVSDFFARRKASYEKLKPHLTEDMPEIILGAEVKYYQGLSRLENLTELCFESSDLLLLEMPVSKWTEYTVNELADITAHGNLTVVLAHVERYMSLQNKAVWNQLLRSELLMQVNASFFNNFSTRRKALRLLKAQNIQLIGSDCHNLTTRPPDIGNAFDRISGKLGQDFIEFINGYVSELFT